ncbi:hypothetical protein [Povalibacter sp.]|uniref:hypothetical protein n=1 Tax=Povalibacter sp. TaxID=1962978 RepID=UPI002F3E2619
MSHSGFTCIRSPIWLLVLVSVVAYAAPPERTIPVGALTLDYCNTDYTGYCGSIRRALDPTGAVRGSITIGFEYCPRFDQSRPALGTLLPQEGGPGYSTTGTRDAYLNIFGSLRNQRDILIIDKRGTGTSGAVNCPEIQTGDPSDPAALKACADRLGKKGTALRHEIRGRRHRGGCAAGQTESAAFRYCPGAMPNSRLKARLNAACDS